MNSVNRILEQIKFFKIATKEQLEQCEASLKQTLGVGMFEFNDKELELLTQPEDKKIIAAAGDMRRILDHVFSDFKDNTTLQ